MNSASKGKQGAVQATPAEAPARSDLIDVLRRFHYGEPGAAAQTTLPQDGILPALLNPYRDASAIRYQYPLYLVPVDCEEGSVLAKPLTEHLAESVRGFAPADEDARILKDNLPWLERYLRQQLQDPDPVDAPGLFAEGSKALTDHLDLQGNNREALIGNLAALGDRVGQGSQFLGYGADAPLHLLVHVIRHRDERQRAQCRDRIDKSIAGLEALLQVDDAKGAANQSRGSSNDPVAQHLDTSALSGMLQKRARGSIELPATRRKRIERALADLRSWQDEPALVRVVGRLENPWFGKQSFIDVVASDDPCATASEIFEQEAARFAGLFAALRIAKLEIEDHYDPEVHDSWFASFDWQAFSGEELQLVTRVVALVSADHLAGDGLPSFSRLLGSRLPIHIISWVRAYDNPAVKPGEGPFDAYRFELAYFGVGHRQVVVAQTSAARSDDLLAGFHCALESNRTSLHLINRGTQTRTKRPILDPWFVASAALESRAHPFLLVNPDAGDRAAERVSFDGNPQPEKDWPVEPLEYEGPDGDPTEMELAFTFADYALLMPALCEHFRVVPKGFESDDLVTMDDYLQLEGESVDRAVPFVWGIDEDGQLVRLVVSRALVFACRDRRNYWRTLQELAGVHNVYVEAAVERVLEDARAAAETEREELIKTHEQELENARSEAAGDAMGQLVDVLMGADVSSMIGDGALATMPAAAPAEAPAEIIAESEAEPEEPDEEEEALSFDEPWLDTAACTTCDDCMGINKMMFAYNDDKQAILKDPKAGTYADLVEAAEICPAKCIHPGKPLDPNEPGLEELIARAEPFN